MDYKKIIKSRSLRLKILEFLSFIPDKPMLKIQYRMKTGRMLNLNEPERYTEKLQSYKLNYKNPVMVQCVDKYDVRDYVKSKGMEAILNRCYGVYARFDDIDFSALPQSFVIKDTLGGGSNQVFICHDKRKIDVNKVRDLVDGWTSEKLTKTGGREWPYYSGKGHRICIEEYLECSNGDLPDYKFFCFGGKCFCFYVKVDYARSHEKGKLAFYDRNQKKLDVKMDYCGKLDRKIDLPNNCNEMMNIAEILSSDFPHARVDFYNVDGRIVFGEITFYNASGYMTFTPDSFDFEMGEKFILPEIGGGISL